MNALIWPGAVVSLLGVAGLMYCVMRAVRARRSATSDEVLRADLRRIIAINMAALAVSALGLMLVVMGILLG